MQRGAAAAPVFIGIGVIVIAIVAYIVLRDDAPIETPQATPVAQEQEEPLGTKNVRKTRSFVVLDNNFAYAGGNVYYRSGKASDGEPLYSVLPVAQPEDFHKVGEARAAPGQASLASYSGSGSAYSQSAYQAYVSSGGSPETAPDTAPTSSGGTTALGSATGSGAPDYSVSYYTDGENVYVVVETPGGSSEPQVVVGADPDSFEVLSAEYASDDDNVYVVTVTCIGDSCSATVSIVASADPDTFQVYANDQQILNSDCTGYVTADSQDGTHVYNNGQVVYGISVYLIGQGGECDNTPVLISP